MCEKYGQLIYRVLNQINTKMIDVRWQYFELSWPVANVSVGSRLLFLRAQPDVTNVNKQDGGYEEKVGGNLKKGIM